MPMNSVRYCGRDFSVTELSSIRRLIADNPESNRATLSRLVCDMLSWRRPDGRLKDMSCRVAMLRMQDDALMRLPPPRNSNNNGKRYLRRTQQAQPDPVPFIRAAHRLTNLCLQPISDRNQSHLWNEYIDRYHYLGYQPLPGAQMRYFARDGNRILALLGFGAAAWKTAPRDQFIGWT
ncbi:MAG: Druantia anti-phage system protein DruA, partial [candidate division Zixibacteria bacterium]